MGAINLTSLRLPGVSALDGTSADMSSLDALVVFRGLCFVRDIANLASSLRDELLNRGAKETLPSLTNCLIRFPTVEILTQISIRNFESVTASQQAMEIELVGWIRGRQS